MTIPATNSNMVISKYATKVKIVKNKIGFN